MGPCTFERSTRQVSLPLQLTIAVNLTLVVVPLRTAATQLSSVLTSETSHVEPEGGT
jgi:hypothetical protein